MGPYPGRANFREFGNASSKIKEISMRINWRGLELPSPMVRDAIFPMKLSADYCRAFERGFGTTLEIVFRRILLSSLEGAV